MNTGGGSSRRGGSEDLLHALLLFACTAKVWIALHQNHKRRQQRQLPFPNDDDDVDNNDDGNDPLSSPRPWPSPSSTPRAKKCNYDSIHNHYRPSNHSNAVEDDRGSDISLTGLEEKRRKRSMSGEERLLLMERMSISDSVLTRDSSMDFEPKNSNWTHFEKYSPPYTPSPSTIEEDDFLWSDPPNNDNEEEEGNDNNTASSTNKLCPSQQYTNSLLKNKPTSSSNFGYTRRNSTEEKLHFNANCLPNKLILLRHGQSEGNVDELLYATRPDNAMRLTKLGWEMARMAGRALKQQLDPNETVHFIVSPYARTVETFHGIVSAWCDPDVDEEVSGMRNRSKRLKLWYTKLMDMGLTWHEDPRIREQDFGNYQDPQVIKKAKAERHKFGSFYYRFPHGESASDVFDRVSTFLDSLWRSFESGRAQNYVLVAHGISVRVFLSRYFRYSIDQFHMLANPRNCEMITLAHDGLGRLKLDGRCELELSEVPVREEATEHDEEREKHWEEANGNTANGTINDRGARMNGNEKKGDTQQKKTKVPTSATATATRTVVTGYKKHSRLRTLPPKYMRPRTVRMCYSDTVT